MLLAKIDSRSLGRQRFQHNLTHQVLLNYGVQADQIYRKRSDQGLLRALS
jgi:hypothetical protein